MCVGGGGAQTYHCPPIKKVSIQSSMCKVKKKYGLKTDLTLLLMGESSLCGGNGFPQ